MLKNNICLIEGKPLNGKMEVITEIIYEYAIKNDKKTLFLTLEGSSNFYLSYLYSRISGINRKLIEKYLNPCLGQSKGKSTIDYLKLFEAIEMIQEKEFYLIDNVFTPNYLDYLLEFNELEHFDLIIINTFDLFRKKLNISNDNLLKILKKSCKKYKTKIIFINNEISNNKDIKKYVVEGKNSCKVS